MNTGLLDPPKTPATPPANDSMDALLHRAVQTDASDVHLVAGSPPAFRRHGRLFSTGDTPMESRPLASMIRSIMPAELSERFADQRDVDFALQCPIDAAARRFRVNAFHTRGAPGCSIRVILDEIPTFEWAGFPVGIADRIADFRNGLVLFTGVTGSGKSTTMAMLIDLINRRGGYRIITLEEPIEYLFKPQRDSIISQRELGADVRSFADGLKFGLRQDPDVILVGEIRDREAAQLAISAAETGHLVLSTMHTRDAKGAITRLTDMFSQDIQGELRSQLAMSLRCVVSQHLVPPAKDGDRRVLALEVMFNNLPVSSAIRFGKIEALGDAINAGKADGMIGLDDCLNGLLATAHITAETARRFANN
ncbi:MAG: PilT/PilU family type 4a pilus ATPase, partial [Phycisphaerales bacterium]|nr:PilT/PilU family type 4a pilus ATPase [Phycisphaerales bacterium]